MHLLGTIFSCGLIYNWRSSEYLGQQDGVCAIESKLNYTVCVHGMKEQQCGSLLCFCTTMNLYGTEKEDVSDFGHTDSNC